MNTFDFLDNERLKKQLGFLVEIDRMKNIFRRTVITDGSLRRENDAEHSWHFAMFALILSEYAPEGTDINRVIRIGLVHDLVEIYAGDTFAYDEAGYITKEKREKEAADRLFSDLPDEQGGYIRSLWEEFEEGKTDEARFASVCDRLQPLIHNYLTEGHTWKEGNVSSGQVLKRQKVAENTSPELWNAVTGIIENSVKQGILKK